MKLEELIEKHRPRPGTESQPCGGGQLWHLNRHGLIQNAIEQQQQRDFDEERSDPYQPVVISKIVAWELLAEAQRNGLRLTTYRPEPDS